MKLLILQYAAWAGLVQLSSATGAVGDMPRVIATASVLGSLTVLVYRLGVWRQEMESTKASIGFDVRSHREESTANFARIERRLEALDRMMTESLQFKQQALRRHRRTTRRLDRMEEHIK